MNSTSSFEVEVLAADPDATYAVLDIDLEYDGDEWMVTEFRLNGAEITYSDLLAHMSKEDIATYTDVACEEAAEKEKEREDFVWEDR